LSRPAGDRLALGVALNLAALLSQSDGDLARAEILLTEALETARSLRSPYLQILYQGNLSGVHADGKRWIDAVAMLQEALDLVRRTGNRHFGTGALLLTARILLGVGQVADAMRLAAAAGRLSAEIGEAPPPDEVKGLERDLDAAGIDAADEAYAAFRGAGLTLSFEAAIDEAARGLQGIAAVTPARAALLAVAAVLWAAALLAVLVPAIVFAVVVTALRHDDLPAVAVDRPVCRSIDRTVRRTIHRPVSRVVDRRVIDRRRVHRRRVVHRHGRVDRIWRVPHRHVSTKTAAVHPHAHMHLRRRG
jgi:tetratricopeptide (TPR) repeat protein